MNSPVELTLRLSLGTAPDRSPPVVDEERMRFSRAVLDHGDALFALAVRLAPSRSDAEDLFQEALLRAWRGLPKFRGDAKLSTWLYRILLNVWRKRRPRLAEAAADADTANPRADPARTAARRETVARVLEAVDDLPRRQREALLLRARGGLGYAEIAAAMGIRRGAVKSHLVLARRKLLARFGDEIRLLGGAR